MSKPEWGTKRTCLSCGARFYDFGKTTLECPACGASFDLETIARTRRTRGGTRTVEPKAAVAKVVEVEEEEEVLDEVEDEVEDDEEDDVDEVDVVDDDDDEAVAGAKKKKRRRKVVEEPVVEDDEEEESLIEDASELGDDDVSDVIEKDTDDDPT